MYIMQGADYVAKANALCPPVIFMYEKQCNVLACKRARLSTRRNAGTAKRHLAEQSMPEMQIDDVAGFEE